MDEYRQLRHASTPDIYGIDTSAPHEGDTGEGVVLHTSVGPIKAILHMSAGGGERAVLWVWGARGGYAGPAEGIFAHLAEAFTAQGITSLRLNYRHPGVYSESVLDALAGLAFLNRKGCSAIAVVGHSFGGAVAITAGSFTDPVATVVALSPQTYGAQSARFVSPRPLLIVHGLNDTRLPPMCARQIYQWADEPKELILYPGAEHGLRECKDELHALLGRWIPEKLGVT
jgi:alpha/beta superfamily hydrolase